MIGFARVSVVLLAALVTSAMAGARSEPELLAWDDLMPDGEFEVLEQLYADYYAELEERWANAEQVSLSQAGQQASIEDGFAAIAEGSALDAMPQIGTFNVVEELDGLTVRMPGYVVPLDFAESGTFSEFLLVPYFGACIHSPPPPPNQIVYVTAEPAAKIDDIWLPVWVEGVMTTETNENDTGSAAYTIALSDLEMYDF